MHAWWHLLSRAQGSQSLCAQLVPGVLQGGGPCCPGPGCSGGSGCSAPRASSLALDSCIPHVCMGGGRGGLCLRVSTLLRVLAIVTPVTELLPPTPGLCSSCSTPHTSLSSGLQFPALAGIPRPVPAGRASASCSQAGRGPGICISNELPGGTPGASQPLRGSAPAGLPLGTGGSVQAGLDWAGQPH